MTSGYSHVLSRKGSGRLTYAQPYRSSSYSRALQKANRLKMQRSGPRRIVGSRPQTLCRHRFCDVHEVFLNHRTLGPTGIDSRNDPAVAALGGSPYRAQAAIISLAHRHDSKRGAFRPSCRGCSICCGGSGRCPVPCGRSFDSIIRPRHRTRRRGFNPDYNLRN